MPKSASAASTSGHDGPAADGIAPGHFPPSPVQAGHVTPAPRRVRGMVDNRWLFDTRSALYVWEHPYYPQYYVPITDVDTGRLLATGDRTASELGTLEVHAIESDGAAALGTASVLVEPNDPQLADHVRFEWKAIDHWFEEDDEIFVHPRSPYVRVDAIRSSGSVRVEVDGVVLAESPTSVIVFETGLPPRHYLPKTSVNWSVMQATDTVTECPYKGTTTGYWDALVGGSHPVTDVAWSYNFPTLQLQHIAGLVAFYDDKVDIVTGV